MFRHSISPSIHRYCRTLIIFMILTRTLGGFLHLRVDAPRNPNIVIVLFFSEGWPCWTFVLQSRGWTFITLFFPTSLCTKRGTTLFPSSNVQKCRITLSPHWLNTVTIDSTIFVSGSDSWITSILSILPLVLFYRIPLAPRRCKSPISSLSTCFYLH